MTNAKREVDVSLDESEDAAYIAFPGFGDATYPTQIVVEHPELVRLGVDLILDLTEDGLLGGIELLGASALLDHRMLP